MEDNITPQNTNPLPLSHHQTHATSQHNASNKNSENPNPEPNSDLPVEPLNKTHDPVSGIDQGLGPPGVDPYSSSVSLCHSNGGIHEAYDFSALDNAQSGYYQDPNVANALKNWAMEVLRYYDSTPNAAGVTLPPIPSNAILFPRVNSIRKRAKKIKIIQSLRCEVCSIECTTEKVLDKHKAGRKHKKKMEKLKGTIVSLPSVASIVSVSPVIGPPENPATSSVQKTRKVAEPAEDLETKRRKVIEEGAAEDAVKSCTICNVVCNSEFVFSHHTAGKKHVSKEKQHRLSGTTTTTS